MNDASSSSANPSGVQGVCPTGWHVPSDAEWTQLTDYVSGQSQYWCGGNSTYIAKSLCSSMYWVSTSTTTCYVGYDLSANNATGFNIVPSGNYENGGSYGSFGSAVQYWTCTLNGDQPYDRRFREYSAVVTRSSYVKNCGRSVRCIKD